MLESCLHLFILGLTTCIAKQVLTVGGSAHQIPRYSTYEIVTPQRLLEKEKRWAHLHEEHLGNELSYLIQTGNGTHILKLKKNKHLIGENFIIFTYSNDGKLETTPFEAKTHCYYHGVLEGVADSLLAFSTCDGLRGILHIGGKRYGMEPIDGSDQFEHILYRAENFSQDSFLCGVQNNHLYHPQQNIEAFLKYTNISYGHSNRDTVLRRRRAVLPQKSYVELYMVVDNKKLRDEAAVTKETVELVNYVDAMFNSLNIQIVLVGLEIWTKENFIDVDMSSAGDVLSAFVAWRQKALVKQPRNDISHLIIGREPFGMTVGMAFVGTVCNRDFGGSISTFKHQDVIGHASIVAHELGHNLGMNHDDKGCPGSYIMHSTAMGSKNFSSCSSNDFENLILKGGGSCLRNPPKPSDIFTEPVCGNQIVDKDEECDCGTPEECSSPCCDAATCKLKSGSECAEGLCCDNCKFKVAGVQCRPKMNGCDLPEYCNGSYAYCPEDVYIMNGNPCNNMQEYCYNGICQNYDSQCESLFGKGTKKGPDICFETANSKGDRFGNCGMTGTNFVKCTQANSLCGKLHCTSFSPNNLPPEAYIQNQQGVLCMTTDFDLGSDVPDPSMVQKGTACKEGKACVDFKCVNSSLLGYNCDVKNKCNGRAVCNNKGNCHCDPGWAPPFCDKSGYGGSIDSGPTHIDTSLRDGLLVFFLLVLPVLIVAVIAIVKRHAIERRLCRECRRRRRAKNAQQARQNNTLSGPNQPNAVNNRRLATSNSGVFTISHFPTPRPPVQQLPGPPPPRPPLRPPIPPRPVYEKPS
ncbi:disintegrin and metalloproteinase domain-containing protein 9-like isoform X2 [Eublepharis macularius]|uniref:Disintegrin and metalloproteinase domain-containing protein 9-like isoform X2 n=1 Tax=Eublepharis macularius TaxID=481883 RepID=A0AA97JGG1_EUBMA|nr:disintegrin and metalloproteinase domain-containing protein 9-like isoform X2 [Eublepharis macularius]